MSHVEAEIASQPECWLEAAGRAGAAGLPEPGERVAAIGCGTSWFMAQAYAALREAGGHGHTEAFAASEFPFRREYDRVIVLTRSGTTTEVLDVLKDLPVPARATALTADPSTPVARLAGATIALDFADEESVVQTRFATTALALLRAHLEAEGAVPAGVRTVEQAAVDAERALAMPLAEGALEAEQITFLGAGWTCGLAQEAALKLREAAGWWTEAYPAKEYRHGPIAITGPGRAVWMLGTAPAGLPEDIARVGGLVIAGSNGSPVALDPMADLVRVHRLAIAAAGAAGRDPDRPRNLTRSVILTHPSA
jgi:fructoselysine-6-P-deglycase FrlB-like protein